MKTAFGKSLFSQIWTIKVSVIRVGDGVPGRAVDRTRGREPVCLLECSHRIRGGGVVFTRLRHLADAVVDGGKFLQGVLNDIHQKLHLAHLNGIILGDLGKVPDLPRRLL